MPAMAGNLLAPGRGISSVRSRRLWRRYQRDARRPLHCLLFLLPLVAAYELGAGLARGSGLGGELVAPSVIRGLLGWFGLVGFWVPPVVLVVALLAWHRLRHDRWRIRGWVLLGMVGESLVVAAPLLVLSSLFESPPQRESGLLAELVKALGAGVYEELVFRLLLISGLAWLIVELVRLPGPTALGVAAGLAALVFAACHFPPIGSEAFDWRTFTFKLVAGLYLAVVFLGRGLGVASGCHAACNLLLVWLRTGGGG